MDTAPPPTITAVRGRVFNAFACGLLAFIVRADERILMLSHPQRPGRWEPPNGAYDGGETLLAGVLREVHEEAGPEVRVRPLGVLHAYTFRYDAIVKDMISIAFLLAYEGGAVRPGDDMRDSAVHWMSVDEVEGGEYDILVPSQQPQLFRRAVELYRLWRDQPVIELQPYFDESTRNKYEK